MQGEQEIFREGNIEIISIKVEVGNSKQSTFENEKQQP